MEITKLGHSCILIEDSGYIVLFDPGKWAERSLIEALKHVDEVVYTHEHADHFSLDILQMLAGKFPDLKVVCNQHIRTLISDSGIALPCSESSAAVKPFTSPHEQLPLPGVQAPAQSGYHYKDVFTHPGDSQTFQESMKVLAMSFIAPWGKTGDSIDLVLRLKPRYVLPIHDWHYTNEAKQWLQDLIDSVLAPAGITLLSYENGRAVEIA